MTSEVVIETHIQTFVSAKIAEEVKLELKPRCIIVKHRQKKGSTILALLWANVLQHDTNYPTCRFTYEEGYDRVSQSTTLMMKADDTTFTLHMKTGTLFLEGEFVFSWFKDSFPGILMRYDRAVNMTRGDYLYLQKIEEMRRRGDSTDDRPDHDDLVTDEFTKDMSIEANYRVVSSQVAVPQTVVQMVNSVQIKDSSQYLLSEDTLEMEKVALATGSVRSGPAYVYDMWKTLLNKWFADDEVRVYIVTPAIDVDRMVDIVQIVMQNKISANLECMFVKNQCDGDSKFSDVHRETLSRYKAKQQLFIEYKIFNKVTLPVEDFSCNFVCGVKSNVAEILLTSANFNKQHFENDNMASVMFLTMPEQAFKERYMDSLFASSQDKA